MSIRPFAQTQIRDIYMNFLLTSPLKIADGNMLLQFRAFKLQSMRITAVSTSFIIIIPVPKFRIMFESYCRDWKIFVFIFVNKKLNIKKVFSGHRWAQVQSLRVGGEEQVDTHQLFIIIHVCIPIFKTRNKRGINIILYSYKLFRLVSHL